MSPAPRYWPERERAADERPVRRWAVLHACAAVGSTSLVAEAQTQAGMRPTVLTPSGWYSPGNPEPEPTRLSLVHEWQQVRQWRNRLQSEGTDDWAEILHAHCFAAAMAGLRGQSAVVYDLTRPMGA